VLSTPATFFTLTPTPARPSGSSEDPRQNACLVESALRILKDHASAGDRYLRATTQRLIAADEARVLS